MSRVSIRVIETGTSGGLGEKEMLWERVFPLTAF